MKIPTLENVHDILLTEAKTDSYPYGRLRASAKWWIESNGNKGMRVGFQTVNPKNGRINAPKYSTYNSVKILFVDEKGHFQVDGLNMYANPEQIQAFADKYELHGQALEYVSGWLAAWEKHPRNPKNQIVTA